MSREPTAPDLEGKHIASLTHSQMLVLNLPELQAMGAFTAQIALIQEPEPRIYAYPHQNNPNSYLLLIPLSFLASPKNNVPAFVQLLCLCSQTLTVPTGSEEQRAVEAVLRGFGVGWREKRGSTMSKFYLQGECWVTYLDFVTFQAVQFKDSFSELLVNKRENAFEYCLNAFKEELLPFLYANEEQSIAEALQCCTSELKSLFTNLECPSRFQWLYASLNPSSQSKISGLQRQICGMASARKITTLGEEECEQLVTSELEALIVGELSVREEELVGLKQKEQVVFLTKVMNDLLMKMRELEFQINQSKILFVHQKILEKVYSIHQQQLTQSQQHNQQLTAQLQQQQQEIVNLKSALDKLNEPKATPKKPPAKLTVISESPEEVPTPKKHKNDQENQTRPKPPPLTLTDLKEPLQAIVPGQTAKLQKSGVGRAKEKLREGLKKQEDVRRQKSGKLLRMLQ